MILQQHSLANGVRDVNNINVTDLGWNLIQFTSKPDLRTKDWLDNGVHDTHTDRAWMHQADNDYEVVEWPLPMDLAILLLLLHILMVDMVTHWVI